MKKRNVVLILMLGMMVSAKEGEPSGPSRTVHFPVNKSLDHNAVEHLKEMTWLRTLDLNSAGLSGEAFQRLRQALPDCTLRFRKDSSAHMTKPPNKCIMQISDLRINEPAEMI